MNIEKSSTWIFLAKGGGAALVFVGTAVFTRLLDISTLGSFFLFQAILGIAAIPADFGINSAVTKRISEGEHAGSVLSTALVLKIVPVFGVIFFVLLLSGEINDYVGIPITLFLVVGIVLQETNRVLISTLDGELRVNETPVIRFIANAFWVIGGVFLLWFDFGVYGVIIGLLTGKAIAIVIGFVRVSASFKLPDPALAKSLYDFSKYTFIGRIGGFAYNWLDVIIIGLFIGQAAVSAYEVAWRVSAVAVLFSKAIATSIFPQISQWSKNEAKERIESLIPSVVTPALFFTIPAFAGTLLISQEILTLVFGPDYAIASLVLIILMGDKIAQSLHNILGRSLRAIDKPRLSAIAALVSLLVNILLNIIFIWWFGLVGAAVATVLSSTLNDILHYIMLSRYIDIRINWNEVLWCLLSAALMLSTLWVSLRYIPVETLFHLLAFVFTGVIVYILIALSSVSIRTKMFEYVR